MKQGRALPEVLMELQHQNAAKKDFVGPAQALSLLDDGQRFALSHPDTGAVETSVRPTCSTVRLALHWVSRQNIMTLCESRNRSCWLTM